MELELTVGLELHAELKTRTKMFCACRNDADESRPNVNVCPVCMGHPGTLPVINREAIRHVLRTGLAIGGTLATDFSEFDRKNYFYPDIPKNYQISQYKYPLVVGGTIAGIQVTRIHLEEDTARSSHAADTSLVDFNRAGVPLMELVTEPVIRDAATAVLFARELRSLLMYLGVSDANLEKGEMRIEANISVGKDGTLGTKVEVKNLNSFKAVEQAIIYETKRHREVIGRGERVVQETRGWDENKQKTFSQRLKEESHDYRYFPDPDLPKLVLRELPEFAEDRLRATLPELPWDRRARYVSKIGLSPQVAATITDDPQLAAFFDAATAQETTSAKLVANYLTSDLLGAINQKGYTGRMLSELSGVEFASIVKAAQDGVVSSRGAKDLLAFWLHEHATPDELIQRHKLGQVSDAGEITILVLDILANHTSVVEEYKTGKQAALQFLVGQGMKISRGKANPEVLAQYIINAIADAGTSEKTI